MALTRRQREVLDVIRAFIEKHGYSPSLEEIGAELGLSSVATVHKHVTHLVDKGLVRRVWNQNRSIELVDDASRKPCAEVFVTQTLAPGQPLRPLATHETILVAPDVTAGRGRVFAVRITGQPASDDGLRQGDLLFVEDRRSPRDGEVVLATLDGGDTVLRRIERDGPAFKLSAPDGPASIQTVPAERVELQGIVVGLRRRYPAG